MSKYLKIPINHIDCVCSITERLSAFGSLLDVLIIFDIVQSKQPHLLQTKLLRKNGTASIQFYDLVQLAYKPINCITPAVSISQVW